MAIWCSTDIRRPLPEYRTREGDDVYNAPYRATQVDLNAFVLEADTVPLQQLVDRQLNDVLKRPALLGSQLELELNCSENWIVLIFAAFRSLGSLDKHDRSQGFVSAFEVSVWVPIMKHQRVAGAAIAKPAWFLPLVYTAPTASVATGREVFGYPKVPAFLSVPDEGGPPVGVELRRTLNDGALAARGRDGTTTSGRPPGLFHVKENPPVTRTGWDAALLEQPLMRTVVGRFFANVPLIFRKQVGIHQDDKDGVEAGYTALIESKVPITRLSSLVAIGPSDSAGVVDVLDAELTKVLGIKSANPLQGAAIRGCTLDVQQGSEIWVAAEPAPYVRPMAAPGNDLMRGFRAGKAFDLLPAKKQVAKKATSAASPDPQALLDIQHAFGELYFATPRPNAIGALLARHFPPEKLKGPVPVPDPDRPFVTLLFLQANVSGADVRLYEFSVLVPVLHDGKPAWYVPYMFRSPGAAVIHAREWFGHPCQEGFIDFKAGSSERTVFMNGPLSFSANSVRWVKQRGVVVDAVTPSEAVSKYERAVNEFITEEQIVVGLLQARHAADTSRACFQAIVQSTREVRAASTKPLAAKISLHSGLRLGRLLDLERSPTVQGYELTDLTLRSTLPRLMK